MDKRKVIMAQAIGALLTFLAAGPDHEIEVELHGERQKIHMNPNGQIVAKGQNSWSLPVENGAPSWDTWRKWVEYLAVTRDTGLPPDSPLDKANRLAVLCEQSRQIVKKALK